MKRVEVVWHDAHTDGGGWRHLANPKTRPLKIRSVGWRVPKAFAKPGHVTICQSWDGGWTIGDLLHIPKGMVRKVRRLK